MSTPPTSKPKHTNRLTHETSPQHAHNPVDWYAWGPEAFAAARAADKPIFLSVGYSTCYWCHVMERQSFEVEAIAAEMNRRFINIKVDREERPDVDSLYMNFVQVLTRHGGWPMSVFLTPELKPFYGGTYFPPEDVHGRPGFPKILAAVEDAYRHRRGEVDEATKQYVDVLRKLAEPVASPRPITVDAAWVDKLVARSTADYDRHNGGFGGALKFPRETLLEMLLVHQRHAPDEKRLAIIRHALDAMAAGGIRDHLGGGFHRYSTDAEWLVPHFEIMLYDNAMLAWCYVEALAQTGDENYAIIARGIFDFVLCEMTSPQGAFYTAFDAEVDAREGGSYLWTREEVVELLGGEGAERFCRAYGLNLGPNFADPHHGNGVADSNILFLPQLVSEDDGKPLLADAALAAQRQALYGARRQRKQPSLDTKILTSWNALMIRALAYGGQVLAEPRYFRAAEAAAEFLLTRHRMPDGGLIRTSRKIASVPSDAEAVAANRPAGFLDDYAFLLQALLTLGDAGGAGHWRVEAAALQAVMRDKFADDRSASPGGFFFTEVSASDLIVCQKTASDSPLPSGNAVAAMALLALGDADDARRTISAFAAMTQQQAEGMSSMVQAAGLYVQAHGPFTVAANTGEPAPRPPTPRDTAGAVVTLEGEWASPTELRIHLAIQPGYHINAHAAAAGLVATMLAVGGDGGEHVATVLYPPGEERKFAFAEEAIRVYEGAVMLSVRFRNSMTGRKAVPLTLSYQACNDAACLPPVTRTLEIQVP